MFLIIWKMQEALRNERNILFIAISIKRVFMLL